MTWLPLSREGKFHRMRDGMLYHDKPEYYNQPLFITAGVGESVEEVCRTLWATASGGAHIVSKCKACCANCVGKLVWGRWAAG